MIDLLLGKGTEKEGAQIHTKIQIIDGLCWRGLDFAVGRRLVVAVHGGDGEGFEFDDDLRRASGAGSSGGASSEGNCQVLVERNKWGIRGVDAGTLQRQV